MGYNESQEEGKVFQEVKVVVSNATERWGRTKLWRPLDLEIMGVTNDTDKSTLWGIIDNVSIELGERLKLRRWRQLYRQLLQEGHCITFWIWDTRVGCLAFLVFKTRQNCFYNISCPISWYVVWQRRATLWGSKSTSQSQVQPTGYEFLTSSKRVNSHKVLSIMAEHALGQSAGNLGRLEKGESWASFP